MALMTLKSREGRGRVVVFEMFLILGLNLLIVGLSAQTRVPLLPRAAVTAVMLLLIDAVWVAIRYIDLARYRKEATDSRRDNAHDDSSFATGAFVQITGAVLATAVAIGMMRHLGFVWNIAGPLGFGIGNVAAAAIPVSRRAAMAGHTA